MSVIDLWLMHSVEKGDFRLKGGILLCAWLLLFATPLSAQESTWIEDSRCQDNLTAQTLQALLSDNHHHLLSDNSPCLLFLSSSDSRHPANTVIGTGSSLQNAFDNAVQQQKKLGTWPATWLKIDFIDDVIPVKNDLQLDLPRDLYGLAGGNFSQPALLPEELVAYRIIDSRKRLRDSRLQRFLQQFPHRAPERENTWAYRFSTHGYFYDGEKMHPLYRGHRIKTEITPHTLLERADAAGQYLARSVDADGRFVYSYLPKTDRAKKSYNILRHSGTIFAMLELYTVTRDDKLLKAAEKALTYLKQQFKICPDASQALCVEERGAVKLGGNALAIIALLEYAKATNTADISDETLRLGEWLLASQQPKGVFQPHKISWPEGIADDLVSGYYPGEAALALIRLYQHSGEQRWLNAAQKAADYLILERDRGLTDHELPHDHWLAYALAEIYLDAPKAHYLKQALGIANSIVIAQNAEPEYPDWLGSYYRPPRSTPTATRSEALVAVLSLINTLDANEAVSQKQQNTISAALLRAMQFQLCTQFMPETAMYLADPQRVLGAFHRSLDNFEIRIDYPQHNISSLLGLRRLMKTDMINSR